MTDIPENVEVDPTEVVPDWGTDLDATGTDRTAEPPDGVDQWWDAIHPNGAQELREGLL